MPIAPTLSQNSRNAILSVEHGSLCHYMSRDHGSPEITELWIVQQPRLPSLGSRSPPERVAGTLVHPVKDQRPTF